MNWIFINDRGINLDQVTDVRFYEATAGTDEETDEPYDIPAHLEFWLTSTQMETNAGYEGEVMGVAAVSRRYHVTGKVAEDAWEEMRRKCSVISGNGVPMIYTDERGESK